MTHERLEMNRDMSEINMQKLRLILMEQALNPVHFATRDLPGGVPQSSKPEPAQKMGRRLSNDEDRFEWKPLCFLSLLRDDNWPKTL